jgi:hypothetical protein
MHQAKKYQLERGGFPDQGVIERRRVPLDDDVVQCIAGRDVDSGALRTNFFSDSATSTVNRTRLSIDPP